jgi:hypothetical protein
MHLEIHPPLPAMEAKSVDSVPVGDEWQYEPKWDGFRCLAFRENSKIELQSKSTQLLSRYFPELVAALGRFKSKLFVSMGKFVFPRRAAFPLMHCCNVSIRPHLASNGSPQKHQPSTWSLISSPARTGVRCYPSHWRSGVGNWSNSQPLFSTPTASACRRLRQTWHKPENGWRKRVQRSTE